MKSVRAIICDVYNTILDVRKGPVDAEERWRSLAQRAFGSSLASAWTNSQRAPSKLSSKITAKRANVESIIPRSIGRMS